MVEALIMLCLVGNAELCGTVLLPGYETGQASACQTALERKPPDLAVFTGFKARGQAYCAATIKPLDFSEVASGVFVHRGVIAVPDEENGGDVSNIGFIVGRTAVAVIDSGVNRAIGEGVWRAIRAVTDLPVAYVILTHMHPDHVLGAAPLLEAGATVVGHTRLNRALSERAENYLESLGAIVGPAGMFATRVVLAMAEVASEIDLDLGGRVLVLQAWPNAHTGTDVTVLDRQSGILFTGDLVFDEHAPALDGSLRGWQEALAKLKEGRFSRIVPGHGGPVLAWPAGGVPLQRYLSTLGKDAKKAVDAGERLGTAVGHIAHSESAHWELFDEFNPRNATVAFTELEWE